MSNVKYLIKKKNLDSLVEWESVPDLNCLKIIVKMCIFLA